jgi:GWxTD domain-containing protein
LTFAVSTFGALSKEYSDFAKGPLQYLLTKEERKEWSSVKTDEQARAFIDLFWARRDPSPGTPANEFRDLINTRIERADASYSVAKMKGSATDRGKVYVVMGPPTGMKRGGPQAGASVRAGDSTIGQSSNLNSQSVQGVAPSETWQYEQTRLPNMNLGQPMVQVAFSDQYASNVWKMERIGGTDYATVFDRIASSFITQPDLKEAPTLAATASATPLAITTTAVPSAKPVPMKPTLQSAALRAAIDEARAAKASSDSLFLSYGEFVTPAGEYFVPVQLYVPKSAGLAAGSNVTFFGAVENEGGERVAEIEENATLSASGDSAFYARSLTIPAGNYTGTFGLAKDGKPIAVVSKAMALQGRDASAPAVSNLMLSNNVFALNEAQRPTDPFAFGGLKIVPKGDGAFKQSDELWYLFEVQNPGVDTATSKPKMSMKIAIKGKAKDGTEVERSAPASLAELRELKGVANHYVLGQSLPLTSFQPGDYTITVTVKDLALAKSYEFTEPFRIVE